MAIEYSDLAQHCVNMHATSTTEGLRKSAINMIRNGIFDCRSIRTGFVSKAGQRLKVKYLTKEHFHPRQASAYKIFEMLDSGASVEDITDFIIKVSHVHLVTKEENERLKKFQKLGSGYDTWEEQYKAAGIELVKMQYTVYIINGIEYDSLTEAAKANGCSTVTLKNRCLQDKRGNYPDWKCEIR